MQDSLWLKLKDPTKYQVVSEVLSGKEGVEDVTDQRQIFDPVFAVLNRATAVTAARRRDGGGRHPADRNHHSYVRRIQTNRNRNHEVRGCLELDDSSAVHSGGHHRLADRLGALVPHAFGYRQRVRHRLAGEIRYMDSLMNQLTVLVISPFLVVGAILLSIIASTISLRRYLRGVT